MPYYPPAGVASTEGKGFKNHGSDADSARPTGFASVDWVGSVEPNNATDNDTWENPDETGTATVLNGSGVPSAGVGSDGDFYIDTLNKNIHGPKDTTWPSGVSLVGPQGLSGAGYPFADLMLPVGALTPFPDANMGARGTNTLVGSRCIAPYDGTLHDFSVWVGTHSGNVLAAIYDTGQASPGSYTKLWDATVAMTADNTWQVVGDPALAVNGGDQLMFLVAGSDNTGTFGRVDANAPSVNAGQLPSGFLSDGGSNSGKIAVAGQFSAGVIPATFSEVSLTAFSACVAVMGRVEP